MSKDKNDFQPKALCSLVKKDFHINKSDDYKSLVQKPKYVCKKCGLVANKKGNLCKAAKL